MRKLRVAGLFAGIGGLELGLQKAGHETVLLCEKMPAARQVLSVRHGLEPEPDVCELNASDLPERTDLIAAGFPCQDLSQAGQLRGIAGTRSKLVGEVIRILEERLRMRRPIPWVLLENVSFMRHLGGGRAMEVVVSALEELGYCWAYRQVDATAFGRPQRRKRIYFVACRPEVGRPEDVLLVGDVEPRIPPGKDKWQGASIGFYWTEGTRGVGWGHEVIPTLKGGSGFGIPSPPAILQPNGEIVTPDIRDAERLQGFEPDWTKPIEALGLGRERWKLVGNAVSVDVATWIGQSLAIPQPYRAECETPLELGAKWPIAARGDGTGQRWGVGVGEWPVSRPFQPLSSFLKYAGKPLSERATRGFHRRLSASSLRVPDSFKLAIASHASRMSPGQGLLFHS